MEEMSLKSFFGKCNFIINSSSYFAIEQFKQVQKMLVRSSFLRVFFNSTCYKYRLPYIHLLNVVAVTNHKKWSYLAFRRGSITHLGTSF